MPLPGPTVYPWSGLYPGDDAGVDVDGTVELDPLVIFSDPPDVEAPDLLEELPEFERGAFEIVGVTAVVGEEFGRIEAAQAAVVQNFFPASADALLGMFEDQLGLPVNSGALTLEQRRARVVAFMRRLKGDGAGSTWESDIDALVGPGTWSYQEHIPGDGSTPAAYTVRVFLPLSATNSLTVSNAWDYVRDITPAHLAIDEQYSTGFALDVDPLDDAISGHQLV